MHRDWPILTEDHLLYTLPHPLSVFSLMLIFCNDLDPLSDFASAAFSIWSESASFTTLVHGNATGWWSQTLHFDPLFNPINSGERKQWEKIHGQRQR